MTTLLNKTAIITGASSGIGEKIALRLAKEKMRLFLLGRNDSNLNKVANFAKRSTPEIICYKTDLSQESDIQSTIKDILNKTERIDVLIHCAGIFSFGAIENTSVKELDNLFNVNVRAPILLTQVLLPLLKLNKGQIVFINSSAGLNPRAKIGYYAATKSALKAIADSLRDEVNGTGVRVLSVYPGRTASPMQTKIFELEGKNYNPQKLLQPENIADIIASALILPKSAEVTDINIRPFVK